MLITKNIIIIKKLVYEYFHLQKGELIADFLGLVFVCKLNGKDVYISKRALKHFVESRYSEMENSYENDIILDKLYFIIDNAENIINNHDLF